jgi:glycosyltransferase involved in cell wall biosynthesis
MRICYVSLDYPSAAGGGGVGSAVRTMARSLVKCGHEVSVVALTDRADQELQELEEGIRVLRFGHGRGHRRLLRVPLFWRLARTVREMERSWSAWRIVRRLHAEAPLDVIEITESGGLFVAHLMRAVPVIARLHGEGYTFYKHAPDVPLTADVRLCRVFQRMALRRARLLLAPSRAHGDEIGRELGRRCPPIRVIPNAIERTIAARAPQLPALDEKVPTVLFVGRLDWVKGVPVLFKAARRVLDVRPDVRFVLAGGGHHTLSTAAIRDMIQSLSLASHVHLLGHVRQTELLELYETATVCVVPSYYETFGIAALEAMSFCRPVVATRAGALPELLEDGRTGLLVTPGSDQELADAILRLLRDSRLREVVAVGGYERASSIFDINRVMAMNLAAYRQA